MSMNECRRMAARMDQHMQQLSAEGVQDRQVIIDRMMGYVPELHAIWTGTSDDQLVALCRDFPEFYRYARLMEEASEAERHKPSRPYDGMAPFSEQDKQRAARLLTTAATLERGYQMLGKSGSQLPIKEIDERYRQWLFEVTVSNAPYGSRAQNPRRWSTSMRGLAAWASASRSLPVEGRGE